MEQPENQSVPSQTEAGAQDTGGVRAHYSGKKYVLCKWLRVHEELGVGGLYIVLLFYKLRIDSVGDICHR